MCLLFYSCLLAKPIRAGQQPPANANRMAGGTGVAAPVVARPVVRPRKGTATTTTTRSPCVTSPVDMMMTTLDKLEPVAIMSVAIISRLID